ncbi:MAG: hypothetical protein MZV70_15740 [Desulfobacterales bacterium]|nr:hypothetical protein [Desulfobacterales bacterium]
MLADRLRAMAPALKKLQHPNIAAFFELVTVGADLALFLEFVPGAPLDKVRAAGGPPRHQRRGQLRRAGAARPRVRARRGRPPPRAPAGQRDGDAAGHGQGAGFRHRPRASAPTARRARTGCSRCSRYLAPEQIQNQPGDARADIYSVGVAAVRVAHREAAVRPQDGVRAPPGPPAGAARAAARDRAGAAGVARPGRPARAGEEPRLRGIQNATEFRAVLEAALGLSTSKEAAIVRQRDGAFAETFAAAPPIPPRAPTAAGTACRAGAVRVCGPRRQHSRDGGGGGPGGGHLCRRGRHAGGSGAATRGREGRGARATHCRRVDRRRGARSAAAGAYV